MKSLSSTLATVLVLAAPLAIAQSPLQNSAPKRPLQANEHALNLPGATTFDAPPASFNALTASDSELAYHGLPPRPDQSTNPKGYASWEKAMTHMNVKGHVDPVLEQTNIFHGPAQIKKNANPTAVEANSILASQESNTLYSGNWSGYVDFSGATSYNSSTTFYYTINEMVVPVAQQSGCTGGWAYGSAWNGIDGWGSSDVLQAGFEFDAYCSGSTRSAYYSTWYEWYPYGEVRVSSVPIVPGDDMFVEVWHTSSTQGYAFVENLDTGAYFDLGFTAYPGHALIGNSAEFVVEAPTVGGSLATMVDYTALPFWQAYAYTEAGTLYDPGNGYPVDMEPGTTILSYPQYFGPESFVMHWQ